MSKILDNKQIIHIASEIIIILGITFYFSQKNKKIMNHINDLSQRLEEQEDVIQKYEQIIGNLSKKIEEHEQKLLFIQNMNLQHNQKVHNIQEVPQKFEKIPIKVSDKKIDKKRKNTSKIFEKPDKENINLPDDIHIVKRTINIEKTVPFHTIIVGNVQSPKTTKNDSRVEEIFETTDDVDNNTDDDEVEEEAEEELLDAELEEELKDLN